MRHHIQLRLILVIAMCLSATVAVAKEHLANCPKGENHITVNHVHTCTHNGQPPGHGNNSGAGAGSGAQADEKRAWAQYGDATYKYNNTSAAYGMSQRNANSAQRQLDNANCGQFACPTQDIKGRINSANTAMSNDQAVMSSAINDCNQAVNAIKDAHRREAAEHITPIDSSTPSCPTGSSGGGSSCPKGYHHAMGKCIKG